MVDAMQFLKQFFKRVRQVPAGFKTVYAETKEVRALSRKKASLSLKNLSRREEELIRYNRLCLSKIAVFLAAQVPPIIGYLPVRNFSFALIYMMTFQLIVCCAPVICLF